MNNQNIIKFLVGKKGIIGYEMIQYIHDEEITRLYNKGYFNPNEYENYMNRTISYDTMMQRHANRMNDDYYYYYVEDWYYEGYLEPDLWEDYDYIFNGFYYEGDISYDTYIIALENVLQTINYNIIHNNQFYPEEPEESEE